ncbi:sensor histidine kinase [Paenibacillus guangzhouensis]|uniref:sensor histidine kinase n=1 Tax=Paenibacillus guangzhouensis TaxID=1473112 RepID=UPI0012670DAA|nr:HAMP domain-containing sensor histidine kinase [Paenibacillus guangzhouensis]
MFARTSSRLTLFFAVMMIVFLLCINAASYLLLSSLIYKDQQLKLKSVVEVEFKEHGRELLDGRNRPGRGEIAGDNRMKPDPYRDVAVPLRPFYMVLDSNGRLIRSNEIDPALAQEICDKFEQSVPLNEEIVHQVLTTGEHKMHLFLSGRAVFQGNEPAGSIVAGIDVSEQHRLLEQVIWTQVIISILFLLVSIGFGYMMSRRAMKPIMQSFAKQQQFTADASHELRTPLSVLHSSIEVLESEGEMLPPFSKQVLQDMKEEVKRMTGLVSDLLTLARADAPAMKLSFIDFALDEEFDRLHRNFAPIAIQRHIQMVVHADTHAIVHADQERFRQLLVILLDNAMQYTAEGGNVEVQVDVRGSLLTVQIRDTGIGIPEDKLLEVFERFNRLDESRNRTHGHAGLGLSIAKWIAEAHRGTIKVDSKLGEGSNFIVTLPIVVPKLKG